MRKEFEQNLRLQNEIAKGNVPDYTKELGDLIEDIALSDRRENKEEKKVFLLQLEKQEIMERLKAKLACLDDPNCVIDREYEDDVEAKYDKENNIFFVEGSENSFSFGDLVADLEWGHFYFFQKGNIPRDLHKRYLVEYAKRELMDLLNKQITYNEATRDTISPNKLRTYRLIRRSLNNPDEVEMGLNCESMLISLFRKIQFDFDVDFEVIETDVFDDVQNKVDFIVRFKEGPINIGVQFSTTENEELKKKKEQKIRTRNAVIDKLDNIKLDKIITIFIKSDIFIRAFREWVQMGRPAGGPIYYLTREEVNTILDQTLKPFVEMRLTEPLQFGEFEVKNT